MVELVNETGPMNLIGEWAKEKKIAHNKFHEPIIFTVLANKHKTPQCDHMHFVNIPQIIVPADNQTNEIIK